LSYILPFGIYPIKNEAPGQKVGWWFIQFIFLNNYSIYGALYYALIAKRTLSSVVIEKAGHEAIRKALVKTARKRFTILNRQGHWYCSPHFH
jgi:hypothetical protein